MFLKQRSHKKELLDAPGIPFAAIRRNMQELDFINRHLGGHNITLDGIVAIIQKKVHFAQPLRITEIGCGGGDNLRAMKNWAQNVNLPVQLSGIDFNAECIKYAQSVAENSGIRFTHADYRTVNDLDADIIFSSLFCHHFTTDELIDQLQWMQAHSRLGFFINDLHRHFVAWVAIKLLTRLFSRSYLVKADAPLSVQRSFVRADWQYLCNEAGFRSYKIQWRWAFRWLVVCFK